MPSRRTYKIIASLVLFISCTGFGYSQTEKTLTVFTGNIKTAINRYFTDTIVVADIMDGIEQSPRQMELTAKFQHGIRKNYEWFAAYMKTVPPGEPMPYHSNMGISKNEYDELQEFMQNARLASTGRENCECLRLRSSQPILVRYNTKKPSMKNLLFAVLFTSFLVSGQLTIPLVSNAN